MEVNFFAFVRLPMDSSLNALIRTLSRLPGVGPRLAQRTVLFLLKDGKMLLNQLISSLQAVRETIQKCEACGNLDECLIGEDGRRLCGVCADLRRDPSQLCVVETVSDLWALERAHFFNGRYHVLGGVLSAMDNVGPDQLNLRSLVQRVEKEKVQEVILAFSATLEGQATQFYIVDLLAPLEVKVTSFAQGVPMGGELNYLDDATLSAAFLDRRVQEASAPLLQSIGSGRTVAVIARRGS